MIQTFIFGIAAWAASRTKRASSRGGESFSPPIVRLIAACAAVSCGDGPSAKTRRSRRSRMPFWPRELPMMSLENIPATFVPAALSRDAKFTEPNVPCSSPEKTAKTIVASKWRVDMTRANSRTAATPEPSSSAPGASDVPFRTSVTRESRWPLTTYVRPADSVCEPCNVAITLVIVVGVGIRGPAGWTNDCFSTVIRPPEAAAYCWSWSYTHSVDAPIPRFGSVCDESVWRVPNETSFWIFCSMLRELTSCSIWRTSRDTGGPWCLPPPLAGLVPTASVVAAARTPVHTSANRPKRSLLIGLPSWAMGPFATTRSRRFHASICTNPLGAEPRANLLQVRVGEADVAQVALDAAVAALELREDAGHRRRRGLRDPAQALELILRLRCVEPRLVPRKQTLLAERVVGRDLVVPDAG